MKKKSFHKLAALLLTASVAAGQVGAIAMAENETTEIQTESQEVTVKAAEKSAPEQQTAPAAGNTEPAAAAPKEAEAPVKAEPATSAATEAAKAETPEVVQTEAPAAEKKEEKAPDASAKEAEASATEKEPAVSGQTGEATEKTTDAGTTDAETADPETPAAEASGSEKTDPEAVDPETEDSETADPEASDTYKETETSSAEKEAQTEKKIPEFTGSAYVKRNGAQDLYEKDRTQLQVVVQNANLSYEVRWEYQKDGAWQAVNTSDPDHVFTSTEYAFTVTKENAAYAYRAVLTFGDTGAKEYKTEAFRLPKLLEKPAEEPGDEKEKAEEAAETTKETTEETAEEKTAAAVSETEKPETAETGKTQDIQAETEAAENAEQPEEGVVSSNVKDEKENSEATSEEVEDISEEDESADVFYVVTKDRSRIRIEADGLSGIYEVAPTGTTLKVLGIEGDWVKVEYGNRIGYTYKTNVTGLPEEEAKTDENGEPVEKEKKETIFSSMLYVTEPGTEIVLTSKIEGFEDCEIMYQWTTDKGNGFENIEGANSSTYSFVADQENLDWSWKLLVYYR